MQLLPKTIAIYYFCVVFFNFHKIKIIIDYMATKTVKV